MSAKKKATAPAKPRAPWGSKKKEAAAKVQIPTPSDPPTYDLPPEFVIGLRKMGFVNISELMQIYANELRSKDKKPFNE